jgi:hypothetical protein
LKLDATTGVVTTAAASQFLLDADENFTVPAGVTYVSVATAAGTAILLMARGNYEQRLY